MALPGSAWHQADLINPSRRQLWSQWQAKGQSPETGPGLVSVDRSARSTDGEQVVLDAVYMWVPSLHPRSDFSQEPGR